MNGNSTIPPFQPHALDILEPIGTTTPPPPPPGKVPEQKTNSGWQGWKLKPVLIVAVLIVVGIPLTAIGVARTITTDPRSQAAVPTPTPILERQTLPVGHTYHFSQDGDNLYVHSQEYSSIILAQDLLNSLSPYAISVSDTAGTTSYTINPDGTYSGFNFGLIPGYGYYVEVTTDIAWQYGSEPYLFSK